MPLELGLCCINTQLRSQKPPVFCSRSCTRKTFSVEKAKDLALQNIADISKMLEWNEKNKIYCMRLSSDIFPHFTDPETDTYSMEFAVNALQEAGKTARQYQHRIVMHPGQYNQVATRNYDTFKKTVDELTHHANILDLMEIDFNGVIIVHGGGTYKDKESTIRRWIDRYDDLPVVVKRRLVLENCERQYNIDDCLFISEETKIPVVFDFHHYECYNLINPGYQSELCDIFDRIISTWRTRTPLMHISEQGEGRIGHHSDYIDNLPQDLIDFSETNPEILINIEVEAKMKEQAIFKLYKKYPMLFTGR